MDPQRWQEIEALFHQARGLDEAECRAFLDSRRHSGCGLVDEVEGMLEVDRPAGAEIGAIVDAAVLGALEQLPDRIGPYEVVSRLGTGGFCSVYLGKLENDPAQRVAVKVLRRGLATPETESRLRQETEILARLHHPHIARLLGHGTTRRGEPYVVMEFIDGEPIDRFCNRHRWTLDQRLKLFRQVCGAVDYAHANLVIHRDIKPSNLLVTADGTPKLLDFGIAKLLRPELSRADPVLTVAGNSWMTPDFASPEQVREEPLTTATDVYSLGVLLYRLLCGRPPYRFSSRSPRAIESVISDVEPPAPSSRLQGDASSSDGMEGETDDARAQSRGLTVPQLRSRLRGDLDSIVLMALSKRPEQRYRRVAQLSQDIDNYLNSQPISARRIGALDRGRKFVRRHRVAVGIVGSILATLSAAVVMTTQATRRATAEQIRAERHLADAQQITHFLVDVFENPDPEVTQGQDVTAKELLDAGAERIAAGLRHQPETRASLMATMGRVYRNLGDHQTSKDLLEEALAYRRRHYDEAAPEVVGTLQELARSLLAQGKYEGAGRLLRESQGAQQAAAETFTARYALTLSLLAAVNKQLGRLDEADVLARQALDLQRQLLPPTHPELIESLSKLAEILSLQREFDSAETMFRDTLARRRSAFGDIHPDVATTLGNLTVVLHGQGRLEEAEDTAREVVRIRAELYGDEHWLVGTSYNNLSQILAARGRIEEALPWMEKALEIRKTRLGPEHPKVAGSLVNLARMYQRVERLQDAETLLLQALELHRRTVGDGHPSTSRNLYRLASLYAEQGRYLESLPMLDTVVSVMGASMPDDVRLSHPLLLRGRIHRELEDCEQALPSLRQALELRRRQHPLGHPNIEAVIVELEGCGVSMG